MRPPRHGRSGPRTTAVRPAGTSSLRYGTGKRAATVTRCEALRAAVVATGVAELRTARLVAERDAELAVAAQPRTGTRTRRPSAVGAS